MSSTTMARVGDLRVRVSIEGQGPPVLLVMGMGGNARMWQPLRAGLGDYTTIAFDAPGTGGSPRPRRPLSMVDHARLARRALQVAGVSTAAVVGYSFGGAVAQQLALQRPATVSRLVLAATNTGVLSIPPSPARLLQMLSPQRYYSERCFRRIGPGLFGGKIARDPAALAANFRLRRGEPPTTSGYLAQLAAIATWTSLPWLSLIGQPTLVLAGDDDRLVPLANARLLARLIRGARLEVVRGAGHLLLLDEPERALPPIRAFLAEPS